MTTSKYSVLSDLALLRLVETCECRNHAVPGCMSCKDNASDEAWGALTPEEKAHEQDLQRNASPLPADFVSFWS
jgi:hypothetical protein